MTLENEVVLVTGASGNIGAGIARRLAAAGATLIAHCNTDRQAAESLIEAIGSGTVQQCDLSDTAAIDTMLAAARPTMLVNNAAVQDVCPLDAISTVEWRDMHRINLDAAFLATQRCAAQWSAAGHGGVVVNIASIEGSDPAPGHAHYSSSKAGLLMLTRAAAVEFGQQGIRVNSVSPGLIDRDGLADQWPDGVQRWLDRVPLKRLGTPQDVADAVLFLLSPAARWISGTNLVVDGGMSAQSRW